MKKSFFLRSTFLFTALTFSILLMVGNVGKYIRQKVVGYPFHREAAIELAQILEMGGRKALPENIVRLEHFVKTLKVLSINYWILDSNLSVLRGSAPLTVTLSKIPDAAVADIIDDPNYVYIVTRINWTEPGILLMQTEKFQILGSAFARSFTWWVLAFLVLASVAISGIVLLIFRKKSVEANHVLNSLAQGNLKARFHISRLDEVGQLMNSFNKMANQVEILVSKLRESEKKRLILLRELGHDLRTPLTSVQITLETIHAHFHEVPPEERESMIEMVRSEISYMKRLTEFLFALSEAGDPDYTVKFDRVDLLTLLRKETGEREKEGRKKMQLRIEGEAPISGDPTLLSRLLRNVVENALRFARTEVEVRWVADSRGGGVLSIIDDGEGMSPDKIAAFGTPRKLSAGPEDIFHSKSLGIGSSIVKAIADLHDWKLEIKSNSGEGTTLCFHIPAYSEQSHSQDQAA